MRTLLSFLVCLILALLARPGGAGQRPAPRPAAPPSPAPGEAALPAPGEAEFTECRRFPPNKRVFVSLKQESELQDLVGWIKSISCRPFLFPSNIGRVRVTLHIPNSITVREAYRVFLSALEAMGLTVQPHGQALQIIESSRARESPIPVIGPRRETPGGVHFVTRLLALRHAHPDDLLPALGRLKGRDGDLTAYGPGNLLIVTDTASNVRRLEQVVRALDVPLSGERVWWIPLQQVPAAEAAQLLQQLFTTAGRPPAPRARPTAAEAPPLDRGDRAISQIIPEERTNGLILLCSEAAYEQALAVIERMERQSALLSSEGERVHVYPLEHAIAEELAGVLQGGVAAPRRAGAPPPQAGAVTAVAAPAAGASEVKITPDKATNALVIHASPQAFQALRAVIQKLDVPRRQVYVEATVMEVSVSQERVLGLSFHGGSSLPGQGGMAIGSSGDGQLLALNTQQAAAALAGLAGFGIIGGALDLSPIGISGAIPSFSLVIHALQKNGDVNVLQAPNLLMTDNEKASILVGENVPFKVGGFGVPGTAPGGGAAFGTTYQRQDVALKLDITAHVNASDQVRLEIENEISEVAGHDPEGGGPITNKRLLKTSAVVGDQEPVVLGGILKDRVTEAVRKIPFLGDIPLLGRLFQKRQKETKKQVLLILLTPYIINEPGDLRRIRERKLRERQEFMEAHSAFRDTRDPTPPVDYHKRRGVLVEIGLTLKRAEEEARGLREAAGSPTLPPGPVEPPPGAPSS